MLWEPGDREGHGDDGDDGQGGGAHHPVHTGQHPNPDPGERESQMMQSRGIGESTSR